MDIPKAKSIYIHLPFCKTKCPYCDFTSFANQYELNKEKYLNALLDEIEFRCTQYLGTQKIQIGTIFFGGGTPSLHSIEEIERILKKLADFFVWDSSVEISLEANPGTISLDKLQGLISIGVNRISIGIQTFNPNLLAKLGRGHSIEDSLLVLGYLKDLDLKSWSLDLIYGLPGQDLSSSIQDIEEALKFNPPHISAYALSIEPNTGFGEIYKNSYNPQLPQEDSVIDMYHNVHQKLSEKGFERYEISNWAKPNHACEHNLTYWKAEEYFAFGISAHGYINSLRYANTKDFNQYLLSRPVQASEELISRDEQIREQIMLKLRLREGLDIDEEISSYINYQKLRYFLEEGFIQEFQSGKIRLNDKAIMLSTRIISELMKFA